MPDLLLIYSFIYYFTGTDCKSNGVKKNLNSCGRKSTTRCNTAPDVARIKISPFWTHKAFMHIK
jgi:hypothetical protein